MFFNPVQAFHSESNHSDHDSPKRRNREKKIGIVQPKGTVQRGRVNQRGAGVNNASTSTLDPWRPGPKRLPACNTRFWFLTLDRLTPASVSYKRPPTALYATPLYWPGGWCRAA